MSSLRGTILGVKPARWHTEINSSVHRSQPPIQVESRWLSRVSSG
jgi:hypothetical protein